MKNNLLVPVALLTIFFLARDVDGQSNANPKIPPHLLPCYRNPEYQLRENRFPSNLRLFLDTLRAIESSRGGQQKSAKEISMALLYHLRFDGVQLSPTVQQTPDVTPFAPGGNNYYKYRLTLVGLLPKASRPTNFDFLNETLNQHELCNLHFMLSYSIDPYKRENEDCNAIKYEDGNRQGYDSPYNGYRYDMYSRNPSRRYRREALAQVETRIRSLRRSLENMRRRREALRESRRKRRSADREENLRNPDVEVIPVNVLETLSKGDKTGSKEQKGEFTLGHQEFLGPGEDHIMRGGYGRYPLNEGGVHKRTAMYNGDQSSVYIPGQPLSDCPIENGVIKTKYGSLTIGTVIAGIAAGFHHQKLSLSDFHTQLKGPLGSERFSNIWATTLAGNAADLVLSLGLISNLREAVGLRGGWDNLLRPRTYMLQIGKPNYLTDVELRGALDGLWLGLTVEKYSRDLGMIPLSTILEMYYSDDGFFLDPKVRASDRGDQVTSYAPTEEFKKQVHLFAAVLENQRVNKVTYTDFTNAVSETVGAINSYIPQLSPRRQTWGRSSSSARMTLDPRINLALVIDPNWNEDSLSLQILHIIEEKLGATPGQSNLTVICPFDGKSTLIYDTRSFYFNFSKIYDECKRRNQGLNYASLYRYVHIHYSQVLKDENAIRRIIPHSFVALFMISDQQRNPDPELIKEDKENLRMGVPGVEIIVATNGPKEKFNSLVASPEKDVFSLRTSDSIDEQPTELLDRIAKVPRRLSNPAYGTGDVDGTQFEGDAELQDDVRLGRTVIYKIHPFYFFNSKDIKLSVRTRGQVVTVCQARQEAVLPPNMQRGYNSDDPYPGNPTIPDFPDNGHDEPGNQGRCKKGSSVVFDFENLCEDASSVEDCLPLYISVEASFQDKLDIKCVNCRYPTSVEYSIQISGLTGSGTAVIVSTFLLFFGYVATSLASKLY